MPSASKMLPALVIAITVATHIANSPAKASGDEIISELNKRYEALYPDGTSDHIVVRYSTIIRSSQFQTNRRLTLTRIMDSRECHTEFGGRVESRTYYVHGRSGILMPIEDTPQHLASAGVSGTQVASSSSLVVRQGSCDNAVGLYEHDRQTFIANYEPQALSIIGEDQTAAGQRIRNRMRAERVIFAD